MSVLEEHFFKLANEQDAELVNSLSAEDAQTWEHGEVEAHITEFGTELMRRLCQGHLDLRYAQEEYQKDVVGSDGEARPHRRKKTHRQLETLFGEVAVTRVGYSTQKPEVSALYPQDGQLNLATAALQQKLIVFSADSIYQEVSQCAFKLPDPFLETHSGQGLAWQFKWRLADLYIVRQRICSSSGS